MCTGEAPEGPASGGLNHTPPISIDTGILHYGVPSERVMGSVVFPVFQSATFTEYDGDWAYMRPADTPNHRVRARSGRMSEMKINATPFIT